MLSGSGHIAGDGELNVTEHAPGSYVKVKAAEAAEQMYVSGAPI